MSQIYINIICGSYDGILYIELLSSSTTRRCIKCPAGWVNPTSFEKLGGHGSSKNWKRTIRNSETGETIASMISSKKLVLKKVKSKKVEQASSVFGPALQIEQFARKVTETKKKKKKLEDPITATSIFGPSLKIEQLIKKPKKKKIRPCIPESPGKQNIENCDNKSAKDGNMKHVAISYSPTNRCSIELIKGQIPSLSSVTLKKQPPYLSSLKGKSSSSPLHPTNGYDNSCPRNAAQSPTKLKHEKNSDTSLKFSPILTSNGHDNSCRTNTDQSLTQINNKDKSHNPVSLQKQQSSNSKLQVEPPLQCTAIPTSSGHDPDDHTGQSDTQMQIEENGSSSESSLQQTDKITKLDVHNSFSPKTNPPLPFQSNGEEAGALLIPYDSLNKFDHIKRRRSLIPIEYNKKTPKPERVRKVRIASPASGCTETDNVPHKTKSKARIIEELTAEDATYIIEYGAGPHVTLLNTQLGKRKTLCTNKFGRGLSKVAKVEISQHFKLSCQYCDTKLSNRAALSNHVLIFHSTTFSGCNIHDLKIFVVPSTDKKRCTENSSSDATDRKLLLLENEDSSSKLCTVDIIKQYKDALAKSKHTLTETDYLKDQLGNMSQMVSTLSAELQSVTSGVQESHLSKLADEIPHDEYEIFLKVLGKLCNGL